MNTILMWCMECMLLATIILAIILVFAIRALDREVRG